MRASAENRQIRHALAQRREGNLGNVEAVEKIFAKIAFFESFVKVAIGGGDDADINRRFRFFRPGGARGSLLGHAAVWLACRGLSANSSSSRVPF